MNNKLLDLYSGGGGATRGYQLAGFYVVGVDHRPQPRYIGDEFVQADALEYLARLIETGEVEEFDLIHASPPCQRFSESTPVRCRDSHPDLITPTRQLLRLAGIPYIIENVEGARRELINPVMLCGTMFGLSVWRHRYFEMWPAAMLLTPPCQHIEPPELMTWAGSHSRRKRGNLKVSTAGRAAGIDWMSNREVEQAIPPAFTEWIGRQMARQLAVVE